MWTLLIALGAMIGYIVAYNTYGRFLASRVFRINPEAEVPSVALNDGRDYVPTRKTVIFGHHFTSIAGTGPIVGPAIAVFWGWFPALLWVLVGSVFVGAVHDFGSLVISLRNRGQSVGEIAGRLINPRARILFLIVLFFCLTIVIAIFGLVIAAIFTMYPEVVLTVWFQLPMAIAIGFWVYRRQGNLLVPSLVALAVMYLLMVVGAYLLPIRMPAIEALGPFGSPTVIWTVILLVYCFIASVLPVWTLLQPRDYINSQQLIVAMGLLVLGVLVAGATGKADMLEAAPAVSTTVPADAPPIWPFLFITVACGACSGFHSLVSSGTSSKQVACEPHAQFVGYGAMLLEGALAVLVIIACTAGVAMGKFERIDRPASPSGYAYQAQVEASTGEQVIGRPAWETRYNPQQKWSQFTLGAKVGAFVEGGANLMSTVGLPLKMAIAIMAVLVASFAATTLDTATRLQRYVIQELGRTVRVKPLTNRYAATTVAVVCGGALAMFPGPKGPGSGGLILWPLFGATNQLLAGLAFLVITFYLWRRNRPVWMLVIPTVLMLVIPGWGMLHAMFNAWAPWLESGGNPTLFLFGACITALQFWMIAEAVYLWPKSRGVREQDLPPLPEGAALAGNPTAEGGRSC